MTLITRVWHAVIDLTLWLSATDGAYSSSQRLLVPEVQVPQVSNPLDPVILKHPKFTPPSGDNVFKCDYPDMEGWKPCSEADNRGCWLKHDNGTEYNIHSNYENTFPTGTTRKYTLMIRDRSINADGLPFPGGKVFNGTYPGPWIQACWGDFIEITVINQMKHEGTSIHWHGIRQHGSMVMDGVNGITQCPIAPRSSYTYKFRATQYGTSWYHSHYSVQYADGLHGPLTIHGPGSASFDDSLDPLLMTDWAHTTAIDQLLGKGGDANKTILLNGVGNVEHYGYTKDPNLKVRDYYSLNLTAEEIPDASGSRRRRYLLRLINTSFDTTFIFSIDNHWLQIVSADFVPIEPYKKNHLLVGIGQRYNVIVEAQPDMGTDLNGEPIEPPDNFWIRTYVANGCGAPPPGYNYARAGALRYNPNNLEDPQTNRWIFDLKCEDEKFEHLHPILPWTVGPPANAAGAGGGEGFNVGFDTASRKTDAFMDRYEDFPLALFSLQKENMTLFTPLQVDYEDPTIKHLADPVESLPEQWVVIPENVTADKWIYLALATDKSATRMAHPIHLHGHDFAILQQEENMEYNKTNLNLKLDNPPRRDVVHLPRNGFVVIAFKADNPGAWLMHCHIAAHASMGLALQILERQGDVAAMYPEDSPAMREVNRVCKEWKDWKITAKDVFEGDSGI